MNIKTKILTIPENLYTERISKDLQEEMINKFEHLWIIIKGYKSINLKANPPDGG